jgi:hypothetical protein
VYFTQGQCWKGEQCAFLHPEPEEADYASQSGTLAAETTAANPSTLRRADGSSYRTVPCAFFAQGRCRKGDDCTFLHAGTSSVQVAASHDPKSQRMIPVNYRTVPCGFFAQGRCRKGDDCTFLHSTEDDVVGSQRSTASTSAASGAASAASISSDEGDTGGRGTTGRQSSGRHGAKPAATNARQESGRDLPFDGIARVQVLTSDWQWRTERWNIEELEAELYAETVAAQAPSTVA